MLKLVCFFCVQLITLRKSHSYCFSLLFFVSPSQTDKCKQHRQPSQQSSSLVTVFDHESFFCSVGHVICALDSPGQITTVCFLLFRILFAFNCEILALPKQMKGIEKLTSHVKNHGNKKERKNEIKVYIWMNVLLFDCILEKYIHA